MRSRPASRGKVSFPSYAPPSGKVWYSTSEGITIAVSAKQREIALRNLDEQVRPPRAGWQVQRHPSASSQTLFVCVRALG